MNTWQPIETIPHTSMAIMVYCPENTSQYMVSWDRHYDEFVIFGTLDTMDKTPSHWMPLIENPAE